MFRLLHQKKIFGISWLLFGFMVLSACTIRTHSPLKFTPQAPTIEEKNGITYIYLPIEIEDKGSRTLRVHLRENILDLTARDDQEILEALKKIA